MKIAKNLENLSLEFEKARNELEKGLKSLFFTNAEWKRIRGTRKKDIQFNA